MSSSPHHTYGVHLTTPQEAEIVLLADRVRLDAGHLIFEHEVSSTSGPIFLAHMVLAPGSWRGYWLMEGQNPKHVLVAGKNALQHPTPKPQNAPSSQSLQKPIENVIEPQAYQQFQNPNKFGTTAVAPTNFEHAFEQAIESHPVELPQMPHPGSIDTSTNSRPPDIADTSGSTHFQANKLTDVPASLVQEIEPSLKPSPSDTLPISPGQDSETEPLANPVPSQSFREQFTVHSMDPSHPVSVKDKVLLYLKNRETSVFFGIKAVATILGASFEDIQASIYALLKEKRINPSDVLHSEAQAQLNSVMPALVQSGQFKTSEQFYAHLEQDFNLEHVDSLQVLLWLRRYQTQLRASATE